MKTKLIAILLMLLPMTMMAQSIKLQGTVTDSEGEPVIGATVILVGTQQATITDIDGNYTLNVSKPGKLQISFVGCKDVVRSFNSSQTINVQLEDDANMLDEVVLIGYGTMKKSDLTGSVSVVKAENLKKTPAASMDQALQGRAAGVTVNANSGQPGAGAEIRIRGIGTVNNSAPIYVVDGVICDDISFVSPSDIESTEILKDASSTAIYGSRGANGVILVTTKRGDKGHSSVNFDMYYGWQKRWKKLDLMGRDEFAKTMIDINGTAEEIADYEQYGLNYWLDKYRIGGSSYYATPMSTTFPDGLDYTTINTDWQDEVFRTAPIQNYHVSLDGGTEHSNYSFSTSWFNQEGTIIGSDYNRLTLRANTSFQVKPWLKIGENLSYVYSFGKASAENSINSGLLSMAIAMSPWDPARYPQGATSWVKKGLFGTDYDAYDLSGKLAPPSNFPNIYNPLSIVENSNPKKTTSRWIGDIYLEFNPIKGLTYRTDFSYNEVNVRSRNFSPAHTINGYDNKPMNFLTRDMVHYTNFTWENILTYDTTIKEHHLNVMIGQTTEEYNYYSIGGYGSQILNPIKNNWYLNQTTEDKGYANDGVDRSRRLSFLGRLHYTFKERYLATINFRADGTNKFPENTWGYFPSVALAWRASEESFLKDVKWLDFLKVRVGWGVIGNDQIGNDAFVSTIGHGSPIFYSYPFNNNKDLTGAAILTYKNRGGKWERTETWNGGVDFAIKNGLFSATIEAFVRNTKDMLLTVKGPAWIGNRYDAQANVGTVRNTGIEFTLGHQNSIGEFHYAVDYNMSFISNKLTALNGGERQQVDGIRVNDKDLPLYTFWGYNYQGIYSADDFEADGTCKRLPNEAAGTYKPGDAIYADLNGDGKIDDSDKTDIGNPFPKFTYGLNLSADWKGIDLSLFFQGIAGSKIYNNLRTRTEGTGLMSMLSPDMADVWTETNLTGSIPNPKSTVNFYVSDRFVESGNYLRLKNIQLGYTFPKNIISKIGLTKARVYASMSNVFTITNYTGFDPEIAGGVDNGNYPQARTFLMGMNLSF
ncbi:MAG: TonB-dependent receptor [Prevotella sp.]|nr:TonB-dependent receptor [Prevotella sp.]